MVNIAKTKEMLKTSGESEVDYHKRTKKIKPEVGCKYAPGDVVIITESWPNDKKVYFEVEVLERNHYRDYNEDYFGFVKSASNKHGQPLVGHIVNFHLKSNYGLAPVEIKRFW
jgi:hypothetical protein